MDLWSVWTLVVALLASALACTLSSRRGPRPKLTLVPWLLAVVAAGTVAWVTWQDHQVTQGELDRAVEVVADRLGQADYVVPPLELRRQISEELDSPVDLASTGDSRPDTAERQSTAYDVSLRAQDDSPAACLTVVVSAAEGQPRMSLSAADGRCAAGS